MTTTYFYKYSLLLPYSLFCIDHIVQYDNTGPDLTREIHGSRTGNEGRPDRDQH